MFAPQPRPNSAPALLIPLFPTLNYHFLTAEAPLAGDFGSTTHDHSLLHSSETETPCFQIFAHSFAKTPGWGWGESERLPASPGEGGRKKGRFRGKKAGVCHKFRSMCIMTNPLGITFLRDPTTQIPWNHILTKNMGGGGGAPPVQTGRMPDRLDREET
jgi:hypothetical protein